MLETKKRTANDIKKERRNYALQKLGNMCKVCGNINELELDHIEPNTKHFKIAVQHRSIYTLKEEEFYIEIEKCQLLCNSCHTVKSGKEKQLKEDEHGRWMYTKYKCRCEICVAAMNEYQRDYRASRRAI